MGGQNRGTMLDVPKSEQTAQVVVTIYNFRGYLLQLMLTFSDPS